MKVTVGKIKKRKIILLNFVILLFVVWWLGVFFIMYKHFYERIMFFGVLIRSVYKELHADHETGAADNK